MEQHVRLMDVHLENLAADQDLRPDDSADFRGFYRKILVRPLCLDLERRDSPFGNQIFHIFYGFLADGIKVRWRLHRFADGSHPEDLGDFLYDCANVQFLIRSYENQPLAAPYVHALERFYVVSNSVHQHSLKIGFVHTFQGNLAASYD